MSKTAAPKSSIYTEQELKYERYRRIYKAVIDLHLNDFMDIDAACKKLGISYNLFNSAKKFVYAENGIAPKRTPKASAKKTAPKTTQKAGYAEAPRNIKQQQFSENYSDEDEFDPSSYKKMPEPQYSERTRKIAVGNGGKLF